jgi:Ca2+:H+ antiporter
MAEEGNVHVERIKPASAKKEEPSTMSARIAKILECEHEDPKTGEMIKYNFMAGAKEVILMGPLNILLPCTIIAFISEGVHWPPAVTFVFALLAIAPFAERLGYCTEQIALHTNETVGGLLNATFGNATELIVAIAALTQGLYRLTQLSLIGSVISNILLVLGSAFWLGGYYNHTMTFSTVTAQVNCALLMVGTMSITLITVLSWTGMVNEKGELGYSRAASIMLFALYGLFLFFQLATHPNIYEEADGDDDTESPVAALSTEVATLRAELKKIAGVSKDTVGGGGGGAVETTEKVDVEGGLAGSPGREKERGGEEKGEPGEPGGAVADGGKGDAKKDDDDDDDDEEEDVLGFWYAVLWLAAITVVIAFLSEALVGSTDELAVDPNVSGVFLSVIVIPIIGNAAEHVSSIVVATKNKCDLSLGIAVGSSTQISLCVLPLLVIIGWGMDRPMSLNFQPYEMFAWLTSVLMLGYVISHGKATWIVGATLVTAYFLIAFGYFVKVDEAL